jgi:hypothetical protein
MRKYIIAISLIFLAAFSIGGAAFALNNTPHVVVTGSNIWFLSTDGTRLFLLPETYYLRILNLDEVYYYATFNGVSGKVEKNLVSTVGYHTTAAGTSRELFIDDRFAVFGTIRLKAAPDLTSDDVTLMPVSASFTYLGSFPAQNGTVWYYVRFAQFFGYVQADLTNVPVINIPPFAPEIPDTPTVAPPHEAPNGGGNSGSPLDGNQTLKIILIAGLCLPAVVIVFLLFRPNKQRNKYRY